MKLKTQEEFQDYLTATIYGYVEGNPAITRTSSLKDLGVPEAELIHLAMDLDDFFDEQVVDFEADDTLYILGMSNFVFAVYNLYVERKSKSTVEEGLNRRLQKYAGEVNSDEIRKNIANAIIQFALDTFEIFDASTPNQISEGSASFELEMLSQKIKIHVSPEGDVTDIRTKI